jgi:hydrogenase maturation factor
VNLAVGEVVVIRDAGGGRSASVSVRGARAEVALDLVPEARVGDTVLVHAGVALALLRPEDGEREGSPCA